jgi:hypothetical protein
MSVNGGSLAGNRYQEKEQVAEVFVEFSEPVITKDGRLFLARACGSELDRHLWQGWLEFVPSDGGPPIRSARETTQPNRQDTEYWATGLTPVYLEGALKRALNPLRFSEGTGAERALDGPAPEAETAPPAYESVLNPFSVYRKGESLLRSQLSALSGWHLVNIIEAYGLSEQRPEELESVPALVLVELIISAVRERTTAGAD